MRYRSMLLPVYYVAPSIVKVSFVHVGVFRLDTKENAQAGRDEVCATDLHMQCCFPPLCRYFNHVRRQLA